MSKATSFATILALVGLALALTACGGKAKTGAASASPSPTEEPMPDDNRIRITSIGVDAPLTASVVGPDGNMANPATPDEVLAYDWTKWPGLGGSPGKGNFVVGGKLDSGSQACDNGKTPPPCKAVAWSWNTLKAGQEIKVFWEKTAYTYTVSTLCFVPASAKDFDKMVAGSAQPLLTMVTATGSFDAATNSYPYRLVVRAAVKGGAPATDCPIGSSTAPATPAAVSATIVLDSRPSPGIYRFKVTGLQNVALQGKVTIQPPLPNAPNGSVSFTRDSAAGTIDANVPMGSPFVHYEVSIELPNGSRISAGFDHKPFAP